MQAKETKLERNEPASKEISFTQEWWATWESPWVRNARFTVSWQVGMRGLIADIDTLQSSKSKMLPAQSCMLIGT